MVEFIIVQGEFPALTTPVRCRFEENEDSTLRILRGSGAGDLHRSTIGEINQ